MRRNFFVFLTSILILLPVAGVWAQEPKIPDYRGYVNDFAGILTPQAESAMSSIAQQIEDKTTAQIAVVTLPTVKPLTIEEYAVGLFEKWGIGQKEKDNGVLILMAVNDRTVRIETGYGLEGALPDAICKQIIYQYMIPEFKKGNLDKGLLIGTIAVAELVAKEYNISLALDEKAPGVAATVAPSKGATAAKSIFYLILFILIFGLRSGLLFYFILAPAGRRRGGYWYGGGFGGTSGGFGGGFGGFGGGFGGGGGAGGSW